MSKEEKILRDGELSQFVPFTNMQSRYEGNNKVTAIHEHVKKAGFPFEEHIGLRLIEIPPNGSIPNHEHKKDDRSFIICLDGSGRHEILENGKVIEFSDVQPGGIVMHAVCILLKGKSHLFKAGPDGLKLAIVYNTNVTKDDELLAIHEGRGVAA